MALSMNVRRILIALSLLMSTGAARAAQPPLVLGIQPVLSERQTRDAFQPLADYIAKVAGRDCVIATSPNFLAYWDTVRKGGSYDLVLDAAHFTDYRIEKQHFHVLAKIPGTVTYSLIVSDQNPILDPLDLVAKRVATLGVPSIGAARLAAMFPNPMRQPVAIEVRDAEDGIKMLRAGSVDAAILPTPIVARAMAQGGIMVVTTTEPIPHIALSAAPTVDAKTRDAIRKALLDADKTPDGRAMLKQIGYPRFDPASPAIYAGQARILRDYWGY